MTMVPEAWQGNNLMNQEKQDFYRWISCCMEAWDGPGKQTQSFCYVQTSVLADVDLEGLNLCKQQ